MGSITPGDFINMVRRTEANRGRIPTQALEPDCPSEVGRGGLHEKIMQWCDSQWPRWKFIHHRTDKKSGIQEGCQDFTIFCPNDVTLKIECKMPGGKCSEAQLIWAKEMGMLKHKVHLITTFAEFEALVHTA